MNSATAADQLLLCVAKEKAQWNLWRHRGINEDEFVSCILRDSAVQWMADTCRSGLVGVDALCTAVWLLDRLLTTTRVQPKYVRCVAAAVLYISAKLCEEEEAVPVITSFARDSWVGCSVCELVRMERTLLNRLQWELNVVTPFNFLSLMLSIVIPDSNHAAALLIETTGPLCTLLSNYEVVRHYEESVLALALLDILFELLNLPRSGLKQSMLQLLNICPQTFVSCSRSIASALHLSEQCGLFRELSNDAKENDFVPNNKINAGRDVLFQEISIANEDGYDWPMTDRKNAAGDGWITASPRRQTHVKNRPVSVAASAHQNNLSADFATRNRFQPLVAITNLTTPAAATELKETNTNLTSAKTSAVESGGMSVSNNNSQKRQRLKSNSIGGGGKWPNRIPAKRMARNSNSIGDDGETSVGGGVDLFEVFSALHKLYSDA